MGSFAWDDQEHWQDDLSTQLCQTTLPEKRNATFQLSQGFNFCYFTCTQTSEYCERTVNNFGIGFFACCHQQLRQNEMHYKVHLSTLFPKRNATFHGAFLLRLSVVRRPDLWSDLWIMNFLQPITRGQHIKAQYVVVTGHLKLIPDWIFIEYCSLVIWTLSFALLQPYH